MCVTVCVCVFLILNHLCWILESEVGIMAIDSRINCGEWRIWDNFLYDAVSVYDAMNASV